MGYGNRVTLDVYNIGRKQKVCSLYDSEGEQIGAAHSIKRKRELNGWKEIDFVLPVRINGETNWRTQFMTNEYELRVEDGTEIVDGVVKPKVDWYRLSEPTDSDDGMKSEIKVSCPHSSVLLKKRNIYMEFDDENGIGPIQDLITTALTGTGWSLGHYTQFKELDAEGHEVEKVRTYTCSTKTGAYAMVQGICDKFYAYPIFHGDTNTVDIEPRSGHVGMLEMRLDKNLTKLARTRDSSDIITRLYVEGEYNGDLGYIGIDDVNNGLNFLLDFSYYDEIGALTQEQQAGITRYLADLAGYRQNIVALSGLRETQITQLQTQWGAQGYIIYPVQDSVYKSPFYGGGATEANAMKNGDEIAVITASGSAYHYSYRTASGNNDTPAPEPGELYAIKFLTKCGGKLGALEVTIQAKEGTLVGLATALTDPDLTDSEILNLDNQITDTNSSIDELKSQADEVMSNCLILSYLGDATAQPVITSIKDLTHDIESAQNYAAGVESTFAALMGDMLQDGYYSDNTYGPGQEYALKQDAMEMLKVLSHPQRTYNLTEKDLANTEGYTDEIFTMNMTVHFINDKPDIDDYGFVTEISEYLDRANTRDVEIRTDELDIQSKTFASFLGRVTDAAQMVQDQQAVWDMAQMLSPDGTMAAHKLEGIIDVLQNQLASTRSNWYTDDNGNIMFVSADETNAMMLCSNGFMVAHGKDEETGLWNWRTFGTGEGFTADLITAGILRAGMITILGSDQFYWNEENIYIINPEDNLQQIHIGKYDGEHLGIGFTVDGGQTWQTAIGFDGVHLSATGLGKGGRNYIEPTSKNLKNDDIGLGSVIYISQQPENQTAPLGERVRLTVLAGPSVAITGYQWQEHDGSHFVDIPASSSTYSGSTTNSMTFVVSAGWPVTLFRCKILGQFSNVYSNEVTVSREHRGVVITQQPQSVIASIADELTFRVVWNASLEIPNGAFFQYRLRNGSTWSQTEDNYYTYGGGTDNMTMSFVFQDEHNISQRIYRAVLPNGNQTITVYSDEFAAVKANEKVIIQNTPTSLETTRNLSRTVKVIASNATSVTWQQSSDGSTFSAYTGSVNTNVANNILTTQVSLNYNPSYEYYRCVITWYDNSTTNTNVIHVTEAVTT